MSNWTSINANIHISGVKKPFIIEAYNLPKDINDDDYDDFCNNYKNFKYKFFNKWGSKKLIKDYTKEVDKFIYSLPTLSGSDGECEVIVGHRPKCKKLCGDEANWSRTRDLDMVGEKFVSEFYEDNVPEENIERIWETANGENFRIFLYGSMRDRTYLDTEKELIEYLKTLFKYFKFEFDGLEIYLRDYFTEAKITKNNTMQDINKGIERLKFEITHKEFFEDKNGKWKYKIRKETKKVEIGSWN